MDRDDEAKNALLVDLWCILLLGLFSKIWTLWKCVDAKFHFFPQCFISYVYYLYRLEPRCSYSWFRWHLKDMESQTRSSLCNLKGQWFLSARSPQTTASYISTDRLWRLPTTFSKQLIFAILFVPNGGQKLLSRCGLLIWTAFFYSLTKGSLRDPHGSSIYTTPWCGCP